MMTSKLKTSLLKILVNTNSHAEFGVSVTLGLRGYIEGGIFLPPRVKCTGQIARVK